jgi:hypothetical protein
MGPPENAVLFQQYKSSGAASNRLYLTHLPLLRRIVAESP